MKTRDMSRKQFESKLKALGFTPLHFFGYWRVPDDQSYVSISELNGGSRLRDRLSYLLREAERLTARKGGAP